MFLTERTKTAVPRARMIVIVRHDREDLLHTLTAMFADSPSVEVIMERRRGDRRQRNLGRAVERRSGRDRRQNRAAETLLQKHGWAVVHLPPQ